MKAYCMFDNHTFAGINLDGNKYSVVARVAELIGRNKGASFFVRDEFEATLNNLTRMRGDKMSPTEVSEWVDAVFEELSFRKLMVA